MREQKGIGKSEKVQEIRTHTFEKVPICICKPHVVQLSIERRYCRVCKQLVEKPVYDVIPKARLSLQVMLIVTWFKIGLRMTEDAIPKLLGHCSTLKCVTERFFPSILSEVADAEELAKLYDVVMRDSALLMC